MFDLFIYDAARDFYRSLGENDKEEVRRLLRIISLNPFLDNLCKFQLPVWSPNGRLLGYSWLYESGRFSITYGIRGNDLTDIEGIAHSAI